jgi:hypothetical protein
MSRRITVFVLVTAAALTATPARADRECFENSCGLPGVIDPPPAPAAADGHASADRAAHELAVEPMAQRVQKSARPDDMPGRLAPAFAKAAQPPTRQPAPLREAASPPEPAPKLVYEARPRRVAPPARTHAARDTGSGALIINVPPTTYATEGIAAVRPYVFYTEPHAPRLYVLAPNAKIIWVDDGD